MIEMSETHGISFARVLFLVWCGLISSCASDDSSREFARVECWGEMREVLRGGSTAARVPLSQVEERGRWGVGALEGLRGEVTILDGDLHVAEIVDGDLVQRSGRRSDWATLLVVAEVESWREVELLELRSLDDLEFHLSARLRELGLDPRDGPIPVRIEGSFAELGVHVIAGACPIAQPEGPAPWRWQGQGARGSLVGIYAENAAGVLTHHGRASHLHAVVTRSDGSLVSGHVDGVALDGDARLYVPRK